MTAPSTIAFHESAHVVAALYFGWRVREVTIISTDRYTGLVTHDAPPDAAPIEGYTVAACGYEAERKALGGRDPDGYASIQDFALARRRLEKAIPDAAARLAAMERGDRLARHVVRTNWPLIHTLAARLERDRRLSGAQVLRVVRDYAEQEARDAAAVA